jgi:hypothetical protein
MQTYPCCNGNDSQTDERSQQDQTSQLLADGDAHACGLARRRAGGSDERQRREAADGQRSQRRLERTRARQTTRSKGCSDSKSPIPWGGWGQQQQRERALCGGDGERREARDTRRIGDRWREARGGGEGETVCGSREQGKEGTSWSSAAGGGVGRRTEDGGRRRAEGKRENDNRESSVGRRRVKATRNKSKTRSRSRSRSRRRDQTGPDQASRANGS